MRGKSNRYTKNHRPKSNKEAHSGRLRAPYIISQFCVYTNKKQRRKNMMGTERNSQNSQRTLKMRTENQIERQTEKQLKNQTNVQEKMQAEKRTAKHSGIYYFDSRQRGDVRYCAGLMCAMIGELLGTRERNGVVFLCIGTDRSTGDSLGPLIGYKLSSGNVRRLQVIGTLERPVHAMNLEQYVRMIHRCYPRSVIVAVDASVGSMEHIGCVTLGRGALRPGLGVSKELQAVGDIFLTGIVGGYGNRDPLMLQSVRLALVMQMADYICESAFLVEQFLENRTWI